MGPTWPNLGPRCAPDSLTLLNIGLTKANIGVTYAPQTQVGRRPAVRRKPLNIFLASHVQTLLVLRSQQFFVFLTRCLFGVSTSQSQTLWSMPSESIWIVSFPSSGSTYYDLECHRFWR